MHPMTEEALDSQTGKMKDWHKSRRETKSKSEWDQERKRCTRDYILIYEVLWRKREKEKQGCIRKRKESFLTQPNSILGLASSSMQAFLFSLFFFPVFLSLSLSPSLLSCPVCSRLCQGQKEFCQKKDEGHFGKKWTIRIRFPTPFRCCLLKARPI